jgi:hypothetical protein
MTNQLEPQNIIDIPTIDNWDMFETNRDNADAKQLDHCPCCGRAIPNAKYFINSIWGGCAYPSKDKTKYSDAWVMGVGTECRKKFPEGYVFTINI